jgi:hypothetical protein
MGARGRGTTARTQAWRDRRLAVHDAATLAVIAA